MDVHVNLRLNIVYRAQVGDLWSKSDQYNQPFPTTTIKPGQIGMVPGTGKTRYGSKFLTDQERQKQKFLPSIKKSFTKCYEILQNFANFSKLLKILQIVLIHTDPYRVGIPDLF